MRLRTGIRALVLDPDERIALVRFDFPDRSVWAAPGGGVEEGEDDAATLARELREELGLELVEPLGRCVWVRTHVFPMGGWDGQTERYYLVRTPPFAIRPGLSPEELRAEGVGEVRWWTLDELEAATDVSFAPRRLPSLLRELLRTGPAPSRSTSASDGRRRASSGRPSVMLPRMRVAALLRGINIGPNKRIAMADLRAIVESLGHTDVETYLQSGNVVFTPKRRAKDLAASLSAAIREATGHDVPVVVRTGAELARVVEANPYTVDDPTRVVVAFLADAVDLGDLALGDLSSYLPDELTISGRELYVSVPNGQGRSKLMEALTKRSLPTTLTVRNWRTVEALAEMTR